jgi:coatomer subunit beta
LLLVGDFFLGGVIAASLTKLLLRLRALGAAAPAANKAVAQGMLAIVSIMRLGESPLLPTPLDGE